jgi:hypothetical protein
MSVIDPELGPSLRIQRLLGVLDHHHVDFIVIGGIAGLIHGSAYPTYDCDVVYGRDRPNLERMAAALVDLEATLHGAPADLPLQLDAQMLDSGCNFTFDTSCGRFDILGEADGMRTYDVMRAAAKREDVWGIPVLVASMNDLIRMKRAAGRTKDKLMAEELIAIAEAQRRSAKGEKGASS